MQKLEYSEEKYYFYIPQIIDIEPIWQMDNVICTIEPKLPDELKLNQITCGISGKAERIGEELEYTITASNGIENSTSTISIGIKSCEDNGTIGYLIEYYTSIDSQDVEWSIGTDDSQFENGDSLKYPLGNHVYYASGCTVYSQNYEVKLISKQSIPWPDNTKLIIHMVGMPNPLEAKKTTSDQEYTLYFNRN